ncbi:MAG: peptidylprolyl isomerase [Fuerstiella sp.]|nr:peptidylprolyl isomerase [Fuerstiella sp.]MDG2128397.1 peptidylprolyl isomerase [Fuerstiella sp.]
MQETTSLHKTSKRGNRGTILVSGTLIAILAAGIGMQVWRAENSKAAEQSNTAAATAPVSTPDKPVARVNTQSISYQELARECVERHGREVLDNVINRTLIQQACADAGVSVSVDEVNRKIVEISKKFGLPVDQWEKMLLAERGLSPIQYRRDVIWPMLALEKLAGKEVTITQKMMREAYVDNYGPRVKARMMVLDNLRRAQEYYEKIRQAPDEFENFVRDYSTEPNSRALGGTVPPIRQYSGAHEELRKAAFKMKTPGEISGIIQVDHQYVILKFEGRTEPIEHDLDDVKIQLDQELREREVQKMVATTFDDLKKRARIDNHLTGESKAPVTQASGTVTEGTGVQTALGQ